MGQNCWNVVDPMPCTYHVGMLATNQWYWGCSMLALVYHRKNKYGNKPGPIKLGLSPLQCYFSCRPMIGQQNQVHGCFIQGTVPMIYDVSMDTYGVDSWTSEIWDWDIWFPLASPKIKGFMLADSTSNKKNGSMSEDWRERHHQSELEFPHSRNTKERTPLPSMLIFVNLFQLFSLVVALKWPWMLAKEWFTSNFPWRYKRMAQGTVLQDPPQDVLVKLIGCSINKIMNSPANQFVEIQMFLRKTGWTCLGNIWNCF